MDFLKLFLHGVAMLPEVIQGTEALLGDATGEQKRVAAVEIVDTAINITDAVTQKQIVDADKFTAGLNAIIDGVVMCLNASIWAKQ